MVLLNLKNRRTYLIIGLVTLFSLFAFWLRLIPMFLMGNTDILMMVGSDDPLYNLRQVEQMLANNLGYAWFDPMTLYPSGSPIYWGPLFPMIIAIGCMIAGATTRPEIIGVGLVIPALMAAALVAIMYWVGKTCGDWKTGLLASGFTAIVTGQFFYRSLYGYMDHHIAEVLFSTIFCLFYMYALLSEKKTKIDLKNIHTYKKTVVFSALAGIAYLLGLFVMPTMILFAMIAGIFTVIQFVIDVHKNKTSEYLVIINVVVFAIASLGLVLFGFKDPGIGLSTYSIGHIFAYIGLIAGTGALYLIARYLKGKEWYFYPATLIGCGLFFALGLLVVSPAIFDLLIVNLFAFFGQAPVTDTVQEARGWAPALAWMTFNYGLILMAGGILVMAYNNLRDEHPEQVFALVWSLIMLLSTWQHVRYEYYLAINIALLSAVCVSFVWTKGRDDICRLVSGPPHDSGTEEPADDSATRGKKPKKSPKKSTGHHQSNFLMVGLVVLIAGLGIMFAFTSVTLSYSSASANPINMNPDWRESLDWMGNNTPDTGVNYYTIFDPKTFKYPEGSYGVMSWWDYGHMITYISKRIPNANPFQQGVAGDTGSAAYFMSTTEDKANYILDTVGTRYVITDIEMDTGKFWAMSTWANSSLATAPYQMTLLSAGQSNPNSYEPTLLNKQPYYLTTVSRLHNFDGSMTPASNVYYIEYADSEITKVSMPVITAAEAMNASEAQRRVAEYTLKAPEGYHAVTLSPAITLPLETVPALRHYRLVHESPSNVFSGKTPDVKYVKIFEYVKGAHIKGEGIIEVPVVSNTGREYTYRQESINGEFIVPYSTNGNPYEVKTTGKYRVVNTGKQYDVPESAVMQGSVIQ
ncbi:MAG: oligosaccharyl transferase, archaeosortase A system-associated [Methanoregula sp.]|nr:oligosaccharyl transferase, archaeosortase A system-associated [Methanoregula sp.]